MSFSVILTRRFEKELKRLIKKYPSLKNEFAQWISEITQQPNLGVLITNNCYKTRMAIASKGKGKSGGARLISYLYMNANTIYLLSVYDKSEKDNLKPNEINDMIDSLDLGE